MNKRTKIASPPKKTAKKKTPVKRKAATTADILNLGAVSASAPAEPSVPRKWSKHYRRLSDLKTELRRRMGELIEEAGEIQPAHSMHMADSGTDSYDRDFALSLLSSDQNSMYEIDEAIKRIHDGKYGVCELSGENISRDRLDAIPWARYSVDAQRRLEKEGAMRGPQLGSLGSLSRGADSDTEPAEPDEAEA